MTKEFCPTCGQVVRHKRLGVYLSPRRAEIVDAIQGHRGIRLIDLARRFNVSVDAIRTHVYQINLELEEAGWTIRSDHNGYYLVSVPRRLPVAKIAP
jgi:hypothetical protein